ncbi:MAG: outer membrane beta-barrel protein, partial [Alloprevotella sp.]
MKRIIFSIAMLLSVLGTQTASAFSFDWGVTGGLNLTKLKIDGSHSRLLDSENRAGWFIGPKVNVGLIAGFGLDGALLYSQVKYNMTYTDEGMANFEVSESETMRSIAIPINLKYSIGLGKIANVYVATGPQFD